jgi:intracellular sulfur oxidation DsrE/DsrF family protein
MIVRREFLSATTAVALGGVASAPVRAATVQGWNRPAFEAILARPYRHRQVFASARLANGLVLHYMENSLNAYEHGFGEGPGTLHTAAVLYGPSLTVTLHDDMWARYRLAALLSDPNADHGLRARLHGAVTSVEGMVGTLLHHGDGNGDPPASTNPYAARVAALVARGASFFVCNNALRNFSTMLAKNTPGSQAQAIHDDLAANLLPGSMIVPAGVAALNAAQEARFTFFQATLD